MNLTIDKPEKEEYSPYFSSYVSLVPDGEILRLLDQQFAETLEILNGISDFEGAFRYAPGKWSVKQLVGHTIDTERVFAYRALCIARGDKTPLPGFDENEYMENASFDRVSIKDLTAEFETVRRSTLFLFKNLDEAAWMRTGIANENPTTVRALAYIVAGHELHHRKILLDRYLQAQEIKTGNRSR